MITKGQPLNLPLLFDIGDEGNIFIKLMNAYIFHYHKLHYTILFILKKPIVSKLIVSSSIPITGLTLRDSLPDGTNRKCLKLKSMLNSSKITLIEATGSPKGVRGDCFRLINNVLDAIMKSPLFTEVREMQGMLQTILQQRIKCRSVNKYRHSFFLPSSNKNLSCRI